MNEASISPQTETLAFALHLKPGAAEEYRRRHDEIWPEMAGMLKEHGVHNYSISLLPDTLQLFAFVEIDSEERWAAIASTPVCQRWWVHMAALMELEADGVRPKATALREVFFLP